MSIRLSRKEAIAYLRKKQILDRVQVQHDAPPEGVDPEVVAIESAPEKDSEDPVDKQQ